MRFKLTTRSCEECPVRFLCYTSKCSPETTDEHEERIINITCDVWGGAGPDCCIQPS